MSYLSTPRLHFAGLFQADVSTINNDVRYYDADGFKSQYQQRSDSGLTPNGAWNPDGTGTWRFVDCVVTGGRIGTEAVTSAAQDAVVGAAIVGATDRVQGKLVDLDPQQQAVSEIWGLRLGVAADPRAPFVIGDYAPSAFTSLWRRQEAASAPTDQTLAAVYRSVLENVAWADTGGSRLLEALQEASTDGLLSVCFNVYAFGRDPDIPRYTYGRVTGTLGPARRDEPRHFVLGRQMVPTFSNPKAPLTPDNDVGWFPCVVDEAAQTVTADLGNALRIDDADGVLSDVGPLALGVLTTGPVLQGNVISAADVAVIGEVPYRRDGWYRETAGVEDLSFAGDDRVAESVASNPLVLLTPAGPGTYTVLVQESLGGLYVRADQYVFRLNPGETAETTLYATEYGRPLQTRLRLQPNNSMIGGAGTTQSIPGQIPEVGTPVTKSGWPTTLAYPRSVRTRKDGTATVRLAAAAAGPGNPRGYIDGQIYGVGYGLADPPPGYVSSPWNFLSVLCFDDYPVPDAPTWHEHAGPILRSFGNLYPVMSRYLFPFDDYDAVADHAAVLELAFSLPVEDPNYMPVTRDLSEGKRRTLLAWLRTVGEDGRPPKGDPADAPTAPPVAHAVPAPALDLDPLQEAGKTAFLLQVRATHRAQSDD